MSADHERNDLKAVIGDLIEKAGWALAILGGATFALIFAIVLVNGAWPAFLRPIQSRFALIAEFAGPFSFVIELIIFVGPGFLIAYLGQRVRGDGV